MIKVLVTGSNGQLGSELKNLEKDFTNYEFYYTTRQTLDITDCNKAKLFIEENNIKIIINCAAYTAVDKAESEFKQCDELNHLAVRNLSKISKGSSIKLIHISTDYVFDGNNYKPYLESSKTNPKSIYGKTKLAGEKAMTEINPSNSIIIRTSWVYSSFGNNFVKTMLRLGKDKDELGVIFDQIGSPTYARDLARLILDILQDIKSKDVEIYNFSNEGVCSWYDFAKVIFELKKIAIVVKPIESTNYPTPVKRPFYSVLNKSKIKNKFKISIPYWKDSLKECLFFFKREWD